MDQMLFEKAEEDLSLLKEKLEDNFPNIEYMEDSISREEPTVNSG